MDGKKRCCVGSIADTGKVAARAAVVRMAYTSMALCAIAGL